jgi:hypothetical protein
MHCASLAIKILTVQQVTKMLLKKIKKLYEESLLKARIANSQDLEYDNKISEALKLLNKHENVVKNGYEMQIEYYLIRSRLKQKLNNFVDAIEDTKVAQDIINSNNEYNAIDLLYLQKYILFLQLRAYKSLNNDTWNKIEEEYKNIYIDNQNDKLNKLYEQWLPLPSVGTSL